MKVQCPKCRQTDLDIKQADYDNVREDFWTVLMCPNCMREWFGYLTYNDYTAKARR